MKVKELIEKLNQLGYDNETDIDFGAYGGEVFYPFKLDEKDPEEPPVDKEGNMIFVRFECQKDAVKAEVSYAKAGFLNEINQTVSRIIDDYFND